ncbi:hypothetical protein M1534_02785 [Patescibacteria group bacterium]|nr:hypothetical protein [Patescibacteria group bacterium]
MGWAKNALDAEVVPPAAAPNEAGAVVNGETFFSVLAGAVAGAAASGVFCFGFYS